MNQTQPPVRLLLIEDNEHDQLIFRRALQSDDVHWEITMCEQAEEALERLSADASSFDLLVIDHGLPGMSGLDLCKKLVGKMPLWPLVILTGGGSEQLAVEALKIGVSDYLVKDSGQGYLKLLPMVLLDAVQKHRDRLARKQAEEKLKVSLEEKKILLKEIHHRVKNNLQIISSLLSLQANVLTDPSTLHVFEESQNRIRSMALIHEQLYQSEDLARINFAQYVTDLVYSLFYAYDTHAAGITPIFDVEEIFLDIDTAIPCGLILNELVSNCLKHAFPEGTIGEIHTTLRRENDQQLTLIVRDKGIGFPDDLDFRKTDSLGLQLVCSLTDQLGGIITFDRSRGTAFQITFPQKPLFRSFGS